MTNVPEATMSIKARVSQMLLRGHVPLEIVKPELLQHLEIETLHATAVVASRGITNDSIVDLLVNQPEIIKQLALAELDRKFEMMSYKTKMMESSLSDLALRRELEIR